MPTFFQLKTYLTHWLDQVSEHSLHSPFFFDFYKNVLHTNNEDNARFAPIEAKREAYLHNDAALTINDLGAGSAILKTSTRKISDIARTGLTPAKYSRLYARIIEHFKCRTVIELGTSLGINTLYLATKKDSQVISFEGAASIVQTARATFQNAGAANIKLIEGDINNTLQSFLGNTSSIDFAFLDANHRYEPTIKYFNMIVQKLHANSVVVLDDIYYSPEMEKAWKQIQYHPLVYGSIDLYRCGLLFFDPSLNKQHVVLQY